MDSEKNESTLRNPPPTPNVAFVGVENDGHVEYEFIYRQNRVSRAGLKHSQLVDGAVLTTHTESFGYVQVTCSAVYHAQ